MTRGNIYFSSPINKTYTDENISTYNSCNNALLSPACLGAQGAWHVSLEYDFDVCPSSRPQAGRQAGMAQECLSSIRQDPFHGMRSEVQLPVVTTVRFCNSMSTL